MNQHRFAATSSPSSLGASCPPRDADEAADHAADRIVRSIQRPRIPLRISVTAKGVLDGVPQ
ncbi:hypothetical protein ABH935_001219 [Catenulispora sp. GAS73]